MSKLKFKGRKTLLKIKFLQTCTSQTSRVLYTTIWAILHSLLCKPWLVAHSVKTRAQSRCKIWQVTAAEVLSRPRELNEEVFRRRRGQRSCVCNSNIKVGLCAVTRPQYRRFLPIHHRHQARKHLHDEASLQHVQPGQRDHIIKIFKIFCQL